MKRTLSHPPKLPVARLLLAAYRFELIRNDPPRTTNPRGGREHVFMLAKNSSGRGSALVPLGDGTARSRRSRHRQPAPILLSRSGGSQCLVQLRARILVRALLSQLLE